MDKHQKIDIELGNLLVNPGNYRFDPVKDQREAMLTMLSSQKSKIVRLSRDIAEHGLNPTRRLQVKETEDGKYVLLEGNRRVTVLKLISNPNEIPGEYPFRDVFENLHAVYKDSLPKTVECVAYPEDQQAIADRWILLEHTGENQGVGTVPWDSVQRLRFESRQKQTVLPKVLQVFEFMENKGIDSTGIDSSNMERLISSPYVRQRIGIEFARKKLVLTAPEENVVQNFKIVADRMSAKGFAVDQIYTAKKREDWIGEVLGQKPPTPTPSSAPTPDPVQAATPLHLQTQNQFRRLPPHLQIVPRLPLPLPHLYLCLVLTLGLSLRPRLLQPLLCHRLPPIMQVPIRH